MVHTTIYSHTTDRNGAKLVEEYNHHLDKKDQNAKQRDSEQTICLTSVLDVTGTGGVYRR